MINGVTVNPNASLYLPDICCLLGAWLNRMRLVQILKAYRRIKSVIYKVTVIVMASLWLDHVLDSYVYHMMFWQLKLNLYRDREIFFKVKCFYFVKDFDKLLWSENGNRANVAYSACSKRVDSQTHRLFPSLWAGGILQILQSDWLRSCLLTRQELLRDDLCNAFWKLENHKNANIYILTYRHGF